MYDKQRKMTETIVELKEKGIEQRAAKIDRDHSRVEGGVNCTESSEN